MNIYIESLGCVRNNVDSEVMAGHLEIAGHIIVDDPASASVIIVNTCGFISAASEEAVDIILSMAQLKKKGKLKRLIVTGCLVERYKGDDLGSTMPEVDAFLGTGAVNSIVNAVEDKSIETLTIFPDPGKQSRADEFSPLPRKFTSLTPAYIKISEGCKRKCTYCIIPKLRGPQRSKPVDAILREAKEFVVKGSKEIILVAESTTDYGHDLIDNMSLENVLVKIAREIAGQGGLSVESAWIRLLYTYPSTLSKNIINTIINSPEICSYFDVPVQHASSKILKRMGRDYSKDDLYDLFRFIREKDPDAALRTTIITGFPGETEEGFNDLLKFVKSVKFDHLGVFTYSDSTDLKSHNFNNHVSSDIALKRHDIIMEAQAQISYEINLKHIGKTFQVLVEEKSENGIYLGRTRFQAPEVDGLTFIYGFDLEIGTHVDVKITEAFEYDIAGEVA
jgi:ribosomal protein S12 methylthiotransferase